MNHLIKDNKAYTLTADKHQKVSFLMKTGNDTVRNVMSLEGAIRIMKEGQITDGNAEHPHHTICVNGKYFFPGEVEEIHDEMFMNAAMTANPKPEIEPQKKGKFSKHRR